MIGAGSVSLLFVITLAIMAIVGGKEEAPSMEIAGLEEYGEETRDLLTENIMVEDGQTKYWNIGRPGNTTDIILVTGVQVLIAWSDDERAPVTRPFYTNTPDTFTLSIIGEPLLDKGLSSGENSTNQTSTSTIRQSSTSQMGTTRVILEILNNPILLEREGNETGDDWQWNPEGEAEPGNTGLFINVTCIAGDIVSSRPALLRYTDPGDEISMSVAVSYKVVPEEVVTNWLESNSRSGPDDS
jgi:hypothetical protein